MIHASDESYDLNTPARNNYFYGKLLDAYHFELETDYSNRKRWLLNRLVHGYGVVCGLDVARHPDPHRPTHVVVRSGLAIDGCGREIVVPCDQQYELPIDKNALTQPAQRQGQGPHHHHYKLSICYHDCLVEPAAVHASDCKQHEPCQPGTVEERFRIQCEPGRFPLPKFHGEDFIKEVGADFSKCRGTSPEQIYELCYRRLVDAISKQCARCPNDPCIPLANLCVEHDPTTGELEIPVVNGVDIVVRPVVFSNPMLFQLLLSLVYEF